MSTVAVLELATLGLEIFAALLSGGLLISAIEKSATKGDAWGWAVMFAASSLTVALLFWGLVEGGTS